MNISRIDAGKRTSRNGQGTVQRKAYRLLLQILLVCMVLLPNACTRTHQNTSVIKRSFSGYYKTVDLASTNTLKSSLNTLLKDYRIVSRKHQWAFLDQSEKTSIRPDSVRLFYTRRIVSSSFKASGKNQAKPDYWNREHVWPKSYGIKKNIAEHDLHNIVAADRTVNSSRGNKYFDEGGKLHAECTGCRYDKDSWEPPTDVKGDIARIVFYMVLRYELEGVAGPGDLRLVSNRNHVAGTTAFGELDLLFEWHCSDAVSRYEQDRNQTIFQFQGNRNPFIDHPAWVETIYSRSCTGTS